MIRVAISTLALVLAVVAPASATAAKPQAGVIAVSYKQGNPFLDVVVAVPKHAAAGHGCATEAVRVTVTYIAQNGDVVTLDSGAVPIADAIPVGAIDEHTFAVDVQVQLGTASPPAANPGYTATAELVRVGGCEDDDD